MQQAENRPTDKFEISIELEGKTYKAYYEVHRDQDILTVTSFDHGAKSTQLGAIDTDWLARQLLRELIRENSVASGVPIVENTARTMAKGFAEATMQEKTT